MEALPTSQPSTTRAKQVQSLTGVDNEFKDFPGPPVADCTSNAGGLGFDPW